MDAPLPVKSHTSLYSNVTRSRVLLKSLAAPKLGFSYKQNEKGHLVLAEDIDWYPENRQPWVIAEAALSFYKHHVTYWNASDIPLLEKFKINLIKVGHVNESSKVIVEISITILNLTKGNTLIPFLRTGDLLVHVCQNLDTLSIGRLRISSKDLRTLINQLIKNAAAFSLTNNSPKKYLLGTRLISELPVCVLLDIPPSKTEGRHKHSQTSQKSQRQFSKVPITTPVRNITSCISEEVNKYITDIFFIKTEIFLNKMFSEIPLNYTPSETTRTIVLPKDENQVLNTYELIRDQEPLFQPQEYPPLKHCIVVNEILKTPNFQKLLIGKGSQEHGLQLFNFYLHCPDIFISFMRIYFRVAALDSYKALFFSLRLVSLPVRLTYEHLLPSLGCMWRTLLKLLPLETPYIMIPIDILHFAEYETLLIHYSQLREIEFGIAGISGQIPSNQKENELSERHVQKLIDRKVNVNSLSVNSLFCDNDTAKLMTQLNIHQLGWISDVDTFREPEILRFLPNISSFRFGINDLSAYKSHNDEAFNSVDITEYERELMHLLRGLEELELNSTNNSAFLFSRVKLKEKDQEYLGPIPFPKLKTLTIKGNTYIQNVFNKKNFSHQDLHNLNYDSLDIDFNELMEANKILFLETLTFSRCTFGSLRSIQRSLNALANHKNLKKVVIYKCTIAKNTLKNMQHIFGGKLVLIS